MTTIDEKVVSLKFDNKQFEAASQKTLATLDNLKSKLGLSDSAKAASKSLSEIQQSTNKVKFEGMYRAIEQIGDRFTTTGLVVMTTIQNLTNSAVNAGKRIVSALTIDPIKTGFQEYETQINAVQTILANTESKGSTLKDVNKALDELNHYADMTIYNFTEMTRNIGTFTAAGVDLDTSVSAIKGIANLAAVSGSTSQQASTAMYQLSQALASGTVKLQDWNSVVNAGMGGQVFQDALKQTAKVHGINIDEMIKKEGSFRETLKNGWLTSAILTETLSKFTGDLNEEQLKSMGYNKEQIKEIMKMGETANDAATKVKTFTQLFDTLAEAAQSGWTQSWEIIIGDFEEAKELLTTISDVVSQVINDTSDARNAVLQEWKDLGGRKDLIDAFSNLFNAVVKVLTPIKEAFEEVIPPITGKNLADLTAGFKAFTEKLIIAEPTATKIKDAFKGIFSVVSLGLTIIKSFGSMVARVFGAILKNVFKILPTGLNSISDLGKGISDFIASIQNGKSVEQFFENIGNVLVDIVNNISSFAGIILGGLGSALSFVLEKLQGITTAFSGFVAEGTSTRFTGVADVFVKIGNSLKKVFDFVAPLGTVLSNVFRKIGEVISNVAGNVSKGFSGNGFSTILDVFNSAAFVGLVVILKKFAENVGGVIDKLEDLGGVQGLLDDLGDTLGSMQDNLKADSLSKIAKAILMLAGALFIMSLIDSDKLSGSLVAITILLGEMTAMAAGLTKVLSTVSIKQLAGFFAFGTLFRQVATSLLIFSAAMLILSTLSWEDMAKGLVAITVYLTSIVGLGKLMAKNEKNLAQGISGIVKVSAALLIMGIAMKVIASIPWKGMVKGLAAISVLMLVISKFAKATSGAKGMKSLGFGMMLTATSMIIMAKAISMLGSLSLETLGKGLISMGVGLGIFTGAMILLNKFGGKFISIGASFVLMSTSLLIFAKAMEAIGSLSLKEIGKGLISFAVGLGLMVAALILLNKFGGMFAAGNAAAIFIMANAMLVLAGSLKIMGSMSWEQIAAGLVLMAGALGILIAAAAIINTMALAPSLMALSTSILILGAGFFAAGAGILMFSAGLAALSVSGVAGMGALITILTMIINLIPTLAQSLAQALVTFVTTLASAAQELATAIGTILTALVPVVVEFLTTLLSELLTMAQTLIPQFVETVTLIISSILASIQELSPQIRDTVIQVASDMLTALETLIPKLGSVGTKAIKEFLKCVRNCSPDIMNTGMTLIKDFLSSIRDNIGEIVTIAAEIIMNFLDGIAANIGGIIDSAFQLIISFINGLADAVDANHNDLFDAVGHLIESIINAIIDLFFKIINVGGDLVGKLGEGIGNAIEDAKKAIGDVIQGVIDKVGEFFTNMLNAGGNLVQGLIDGITGRKQDAIDAGHDLGSDTAQATDDGAEVKSPSRHTMRTGKYLVQGLIKGIEGMASKAISTARNFGVSVASAIENSTSLSSNYIPVTVTPVVDLNNATLSTLQSLGSLQTGSYDLSGNINTSLLAGDIDNLAQTMTKNTKRSNRDVVDALVDLKNIIRDSVGDTYVNGDFSGDSHINGIIGDLVTAISMESRM